jgi:integrase
MKKIREGIEEYLAVRRALGFKMLAVGRFLRDFVHFAELEGAPRITTELAVRWATHRKTCQPPQWANRLCALRLFAEYWKAVDPKTEVPPRGLLPHRYKRKPPYIYSDEEVARLVQLMKEIESPMQLDGLTYSTLTGLLAVTGMRVNEALSLSRDDVNLRDGVITVRNTKSGEIRLLPVHATTLEILRGYGHRRDHIVPHPRDPYFFIIERGVRPCRTTLFRLFVNVSRQIGIRGPNDSHGPRLHDLRHRFAVERG